MTYLAVEDFGTSGLTGDVTANSEMERGNNFWGFFRSIGISPKGADEGGSWGVGKWVFPDASIINAFLGVTQRAGTDEWLLMGQAMLKTHSIGDDKYPPYGSFAAYSDDPDHLWLPLPTQEEHHSLHACEEFNLQRISRGPGLSVVIPYPKDELTPSAIARAVVTQYFMAIVRGDLIVEIDHPAHANIRIDGGTIEEQAKDIAKSDRDDESPESMVRAIRFARQSMTLPADEYIGVNARRINDNLDAGSLRERFAAGETLSFLVDARVQSRNNRPAADSTFRLHLQKDEHLDEGHDYFVRGHLRIPRMDHIKGYKARALVLVDNNSDLGHLLRDSEGPAHMSWDPHATRLKDGWVGGYNRVQEVRRAAVTILRVLTEQARTLQRHALADLFPSPRTPTNTDNGPGHVPGDQGGKVEPPPPRQAPLNVQQISSGFRVSRGSENATPLGTWDVRVAYDVSRGNAFRDFAAGVRSGVLDFSLLDDGQFSFSSDGCSWHLVDHNRLQLTVEQEDFTLSVTGFDGRDVITDIQRSEVSDEDEATE